MTITLEELDSFDQFLNAYGSSLQVKEAKRVSAALREAWADRDRLKSAPVWGPSVIESIERVRRDSEAAGRKAEREEILVELQRMIADRKQRMEEMWPAGSECYSRELWTLQNEQCNVLGFARTRIRARGETP